MARADTEAEQRGAFPDAPAAAERVRPDLRPLALIAALVAVLAATGVLPRWAGLPHQVALPPLDLFADVRVLLAEAPSRWSFAVFLVVVVMGRALVLAAILGRGAVRRCLAFYAIALGPALVAGGNGFAGVAGVYSVFLWVGAAVALITLLVMGPLPWRPVRRRLDVIAGLLAYEVALLAVSLVAGLGSPVVQVATVGVSGGLTALAARRLAGVGSRGGARVLAVPALAVLLVAAVAVPGPVGREPASRPGTLFLVGGTGGASGAGSLFRLDPAALGFGCDRTVYFSYAGPGTGAPQGEAACPITAGAPYESGHTLRPLSELAATFRAQLAGLAPPVVVVAHSQGAWVVAAGTGDGTARSPIRSVVLLGAFPGHDGGYVLDGSGRGVAGTDALEALIALARAAGQTTFDPRAPLARDLLARPGAIDAVLRSGFAGGTTVTTVTSTFDLPVMATDWRLPGADNRCPVQVHHGDLPVAASVHREIGEHLDGRIEQRPCPWWTRWPTQSFAGFGAPTP